jgi:hypothetical protein
VAAATRAGCDDATWRVHGQSVTAMFEVGVFANYRKPVRNVAAPRFWQFGAYFAKEPGKLKQNDKEQFLEKVATKTELGKAEVGLAVDSGLDLIAETLPLNERVGRCVLPPKVSNRTAFWATPHLFRFVRHLFAEFGQRQSH